MVLKYNTIKILLTVFLFTVGISLIPLPSQAGNLQYNTEVGIPGARDTVTFTGDTSAIGNYIKAIYSYGIGIVGILAAVVLMVGGVIWLTAGGNVNKVETAKQTIGGALTGLVLALTSYMLLYQINPDLVQFRIREIDTVDNANLPSYGLTCVWSNKKCDDKEGNWRSLSSNHCQGDHKKNDFCCCEYESEKEEEDMKNSYCSWESPGTLESGNYSCPGGKIGVTNIEHCGGTDEITGMEQDPETGKFIV